jgi:hypothetical protein
MGHRLSLPWDEVQRGIPGAPDDDAIASVLQDGLEFMDMLPAEIDLMVQGCIRDAGYATTVAGAHGKGEEEGTARTLCGRFSEPMVSNGTPTEIPCCRRGHLRQR